MAKAKIAGIKHLLAFMGIAPRARRAEINQAALIRQADGAALTIILQLGHIQATGEGLHRISDDLAGLSHQPKPYPTGQTLPRLGDGKADQIQRHA